MMKMFALGEQRRFATLDTINQMAMNIHDQQITANNNVIDDRFADKGLCV